MPDDDVRHAQWRGGSGVEIGALLLAICSCCYAQNRMRSAIIDIALNAAEFIKLLAFPMRRLFQNLKSPGCEEGGRT